ncbi:MAG: hypothetical protein AAFW81_02925 [Pseudomonadota bacterium]
MRRNWGLPSRDAQRAMRDAKTAKPLMTLFVSAVFGIIGAALAAMSFADARDLIANLFHGRSLVAAIVAAGFGCWAYVWLARPRFAAQLTGGDGFSSLLRFYARAAIALIILFFIGRVAIAAAPELVTVLILCASGGAGAAAAFQTVLAFVPYYE